jgi:hypothetical protein
MCNDNHRERASCDKPISKANNNTKLAVANFLDIFQYLKEVFCNANYG